jgi:hypothetical protein
VCHRNFPPFIHYPYHTLPVLFVSPQEFLKEGIYDSASSHARLFEDALEQEGSNGSGHIDPCPVGVKVFRGDHSEQEISKIGVQAILAIFEISEI